MKKIILCSEALERENVALLARYADEVAVMPRFDEVPGGIGDHPDMLGFACGERLWLNERYYRANAAFFDGTGADILPCDEPYGKYPRDVRFNALLLDGCLIGRLDSLAKRLRQDHPRALNVRQGYAKCSAALFGSSVITADGGIAAAAGSLGARTLLIGAGGIALEGYDYGFIGGALVCVSDDRLVSFGDIRLHPQGGEIVEFAARSGYEIEYIADMPLVDHGGILVLNIRED